jgi:hypothetical protein
VQGGAQLHHRQKTEKPVSPTMTWGQSYDRELQFLQGSADITLGNFLNRFSGQWKKWISTNYSVGAQLLLSPLFKNLPLEPTYTHVKSNTGQFSKLAKAGSCIKNWRWVLRGKVPLFALPSF